MGGRPGIEEGEEQELEAEGPAVQHSLVFAALQSPEALSCPPLISQLTVEGELSQISWEVRGRVFGGRYSGEREGEFLELAGLQS